MAFSFPLDERWRGQHTHTSIHLLPSPSLPRQKLRQRMKSMCLPTVIIPAWRLVLSVGSLAWVACLTARSRSFKAAIQPAYDPNLYTIPYRSEYIFQFIYSFGDTLFLYVRSHLSVRHDILYYVEEDQTLRFSWRILHSQTTWLWSHVLSPLAESVNPSLHKHLTPCRGPISDEFLCHSQKWISPFTQKQNKMQISRYYL